MRALHRDHRERVRFVTSQLERVLGCIAFESVLVRPTSVERDVSYHAILMNAFHPMALRSSPQIWLKSMIQVRINRTAGSAGSAQSQEVGYSHTISLDAAGQREMLSFHWDEISEAATIKHPHLHIGSSIARIELGELSRRLHKLHVPTGLVPFPMVVRFLIEELKVEPLRPDWERIIGDAEQA